jgi:hypothetical protein
VRSSILRGFLRYNTWLSPEYTVFPPVQYMVVSRITRGFLRCGEQLILTSSRLRRAACDVDRHTVVIFATVASTFVAAAVILHVQLVSRFSPACYGFLRRGEKLTTAEITDIDRHTDTVVIFATVDVAVASTFVAAVTRSSTFQRVMRFSPGPQNFPRY